VNRSAKHQKDGIPKRHMIIAYMYA